MTNAELEKQVRWLTTELLVLSRKVRPIEFQSVLAGVLANAVGALADDYWARMMITGPCSVPNCNCHEVAKITMQALNALRDDHIATMTRRAKGN